MDGQMDIQTIGQAGRHMERRKDEKTDGQTDGRIDGGMTVRFLLYIFSLNGCHAC